MRPDKFEREYAIRTERFSSTTKWKLAVFDSFKYMHTFGRDFILDIGCNTGSLCYHLNKLGMVGKYVGIDVNEYALDIASKTYLEKEGRFYTPDKLNPAWFNKIDIAYLNFTLSHIEKDRELIAKLYRWLKPGGRVIIHTDNIWFSRMMTPLNIIRGYDGGDPTILRQYSIKSLKDLVTEEGFSVYTSEYIGEELPYLPMKQFRSWIRLVVEKPNAKGT